MMAIQFLAEWALRSSILIACGAALLFVLRVKDSSVRLAAWIAMLAGSLLIPVMGVSFPNIPLPVMSVRPAVPEKIPVAEKAIVAQPTRSVLSGDTQPATVSVPFNWMRAGFVLYAEVALAMLLRICLGLFLAFRLRRRSRDTGRETDGIAILESSSLAAPVALGILRPAIVLPEAWRQWDEVKLNAVLAHERSHVRRRDPAVQFVSFIHRALLWLSPLAWFLHSRIVRVAEDVSDDAAVASIGDRASYAEILIDFTRRTQPSARLAGVPMARYGSVDRRVYRILDAAMLSRGLPRMRLVAILALGSPLAYLIAMAAPQPARQTHQAPTATANPFRKTEAPPSRGPGRNGGAAPDPDPRYLAGLGTVSAAMVTVHPQVDGRLMSVDYREGQMVHAGDILARIDSNTQQSEVLRLKLQLEIDAGRIALAQERYRAGTAPIDDLQKFQNDLKVEVQRLRQAEQRVADTYVKAPISGRVGFRLVEPGTVVSASGEAGIAVIAQVQPISVLFTLPQRELPRVRIPLDAGQSPGVEAWTMDGSVKLGPGNLIAMDNQIDAATGTIKLKATFDNVDNKLYPGQFVNVRVRLK